MFLFSMYANAPRQILTVFAYYVYEFGWLLDKLLELGQKLNNFLIMEKRVLCCLMSSTAYLCKMRVGVETTLVAHLAAALRAGVKVRLVIPGAHQVGGFADGAQFAAGHGCNLWHRVRGCGDTSSVRGHRGRPPSPAATHIHLQTLPGHMTLALFSLRWSMLIGVVKGQPVSCPMTTLGSCSRSWV